MRKDKLKSICVFCGSKIGKNSIYKKAAIELGILFAKNKIKLVYGGANIGLMGALSDSVMRSDGQVYGVIPKFLFSMEIANKSIANKSITELIIVNSMHERKTTMAELAEGFIALPGGYGTLEEMCEILTWAQIKLHKKPIGLLNVNGFFDNLISFFDHMVKEGFMTKSTRKLILIAETPELILKEMKVVNTNSKILNLHNT